MEDAGIFQQLGISVGLGLLVGLERQHTAHVAGFRTFPLLTLLGTLCALLARSHGGWILLAGMGGVIAAMVLGHLAGARDRRDAGLGLTTEAAMLVMYAVGALVIVASPLVAIVVGGTVAVLLQAKAPLHRLAERLGEEDLTAIMRFVLVTFIILPVLPNRAYGPLGVLNPWQIWLMVVLIVGISLAGYIAYRLLGPKAGMLLGGVLGGLISSTATTTSYARRSLVVPDQALLCAVVITTASAVLWIRLILLLAIAAPTYRAAYAPLLIQAAVAAVPALLLWLKARRKHYESLAQGNPTQLRIALLFAALFAVVLFAVAAAQQHLGERGVYVVGAISGLTDVGAITLSMARLTATGGIDQTTAWRVIIVAGLSNLVFKAVLTAVLGTRRTLRPVALVFAISLVAGGLTLWLW